MSVRWGEPRPAVLETAGHWSTVALVTLLLALLATLAATL